MLRIAAVWLVLALQLLLPVRGSTVSRSSLLSSPRGSPPLLETTSAIDGLVHHSSPAALHKRFSAIYKNAETAYLSSSLLTTDSLLLDLSNACLSLPLSFPPTLLWEEAQTNANYATRRASTLRGTALYRGLTLHFPAPASTVSTKGRGRGRKGKGKGSPPAADADPRARDVALALLNFLGVLLDSASYVLDWQNMAEEDRLALAGVEELSREDRRSLGEELFPSSEEQGGGRLLLEGAAAGGGRRYLGGWFRCVSGRRGVRGKCMWNEELGMSCCPKTQKARILA